MLNALHILFLVGGIQGLITFIALSYYGKTRSKDNYYLALVVLILTVNLFYDYFFPINDPHNYYNHTNIHGVLTFSIGPLIYLYVRNLTGSALPWKSNLLLAFLQVFMASLFIMVYVEILFHVLFLKYYFLNGMFPLFNMLGFLIMTIRHLYRHERATKRIYSNVEKISLLWLRPVLYFFSFILLSAIILLFWRVYFDVIWIFTAILIYAMSYYALTNPVILNSISEESKNSKYLKSSLSYELLHKSKLKIEKIMEEEKLFLDSEITLPMLAEKASIPVHHLSQIINQEYQKNFYEYISSYRIEAAKEMMLSPEFEELKIIDIYLRVGYNTQSAFNKAFKNITGMTPSQFRSTNRNA